jgi:hypothetical protein
VQRVGNIIERIRDHLHADQVDATCTEEVCKPRRVGVLDAPGQDLVADDHQRSLLHPGGWSGDADAANADVEAMSPETLVKMRPAGDVLIATRRQGRGAPHRGTVPREPRKPRDDALD